MLTKRKVFISALITFALSFLFVGCMPMMGSMMSMSKDNNSMKCGGMMQGMKCSGSKEEKRQSPKMKCNSGK
jgi:hypothetical protein